MTDTLNAAPPLTRRQAREIERRTGVRPVAAAPLAAPTNVAPLAMQAAPAAVAADVRERIRVASETASRRVEEIAADDVALTATVSDLSTTAELSDGVVAPIPMTFRGAEALRPATVRAARPVSLVRRQRRLRGAGLAVAASTAAFATAGLIAPTGLLGGGGADAAQASLLAADTASDLIADPATSAVPASGPVVAAPAVAAPETALDRGGYSVMAVSTGDVAATATPTPSASVLTPSFMDPYPTGAMNEGYGTRGGSHNGIDMVGGGCGAELVAVTAGTVTYVGYQGGYGNHVEIKINDSTTVSYSHLQSASPLRVGQTVNTGDYVGPVGTTGNSTGCHLHFEVKVNGSFVDPVPWLAERGITA